MDAGTGPRQEVFRTMENQSTLSLYSVLLTLMWTLVAIFSGSFFLGYFNPNFVSEFRAPAHIGTVLGFIHGINPFQEAHVEVYGNLYSVLWPGVIFVIAKVFSFENYDQIRLVTYVLNAVIVTGTAAVVFYLGLRNNLNALLTLTVTFTYFLLNSTRISMGEFSYSAGLSCGFGALLLVRNRFDKFGSCMALALITLASLFKVYFALLGIVVVFSCAAFLPLRTLIVIVGAWGVTSACLFVGLTRIFPFYFDSIYLIHKMFQSWRFDHMVSNIRWFISHFGFIVILAVPQLLQRERRAIEETRRQKLYAAGGLVVCVYVLFVMLPHPGNHGTYLLHIVAPIILAYALSRREDSARHVARGTAQVAALALCMMVFIDPRFRVTPLERWKEYGVLSHDLRFNRDVLMEVDDVIRSNAGRDMYVEPILVPLAIKRGLGYVDSGDREYYVEYLNARRDGSLKLSPLVSWLAAREPGGLVRARPEDVAERADVVICSFRCPGRGTHQFVRNLGVLTSAWGLSFVVQLYDKR